MHRPGRSRRPTGRVLALGMLLAGQVIATAGTAFAAGRVSPNPGTFTVSEGSGQDVVFQLDEPIIAATPDPTVTLTFTVDDPSRLTLTPSTLEWDATAWTQSRTLHVDAVHDGIHDASDTVTVHVTTRSESEYYDGYATAFTATITDPDPAPTTTTVAPTTTLATTTTRAPATSVAPSTAAPTTPPTTAVGAELAMTGSPGGVPVLAGLLALLSGALLLALLRRRRARTSV